MPASFLLRKSKNRGIMQEICNFKAKAEMMKYLLLFLSLSAVPVARGQVSYRDAEAVFRQNPAYAALKKEFALMDRKRRVPVAYKEYMLERAYAEGDTLYLKELISGMVARHHFVLFPDYINAPYFSLFFKGSLRDWYRQMWKKEIVKWYAHNANILEWRMLILNYRLRYNMVEHLPRNGPDSTAAEVPFIAERKDALLREAAFRIMTIAAANDSILPSDDNMGLGISDAVNDLLFGFLLSDSAGTHFDAIEKLYWNAFSMDLAGAGFPRMYDRWLTRRTGMQYYGTIEGFVPLKETEGLMERRKRWKLD